jgi:hypothetical protein
MKASGQLHAPAALSPGEKPMYPLDRRLVGPQSPSGRSSEEKERNRDTKCSYEGVSKSFRTESNEINSKIKHSLRSNTKGYGGKIH